MLNRRQVEKTLGSGGWFPGTIRLALPALALLALVALPASGLQAAGGGIGAPHGHHAAGATGDAAPPPASSAGFRVAVLDQSVEPQAPPPRVVSITANSTPVSWRAPVRRGASDSHQDGAEEPSSEQRNIARFVASKYRLTLGQVQRFVEHAYQAAREFRLDPYLVLAVVSVESSFNPNAKSPKGAQGLMQVLTRVHTDKFAPFGGATAAFDPIANLTVGASILKEYIVREGSVEAALKSYVGAALLPHDHGYGNKVLVERERIAAAAGGKGAAEAPAEELADVDATGKKELPAKGANASEAGAGSRIAAAAEAAEATEAAEARAARIESARLAAAREEAKRAETARSAASHADAERAEAARVEAALAEKARQKAAQIDAGLAELAHAQAATATLAQEGKTRDSGIVKNVEHGGPGNTLLPAEEAAGTATDASAPIARLEADAGVGLNRQPH